MLFTILLFAFGQAELIDLNIKKVDKKSFVLNTHYNEITTQRYNLFLHYLYPNAKDNEYKLETYLGDKVNASTTLSFSNSATFRPEIFCIRESVMLLNEGNFYEIEASTGQVQRTTPNFSDMGSPFLFQKKNFTEVNDKEFVIVCKDKKLKVAAVGGSVSEIDQTNKTECGEFLVGGDEYAATKIGSKVFLLVIDKEGQNGVVKEIKFATNVSTSETFATDKMASNLHNTLYLQISDRNQIIAIDKETNYEKESYLNVPFYSKGTSKFYNAKRAENIATYGSMVIIGAFTYKNNTGKVFVYFDNILSGFSPRFELVDSKEGKSVEQYFGYTVTVTHKRFYAGGYASYDTTTGKVVSSDVVFESKNITTVCIDRTCECIHDSYYDEKTKKCYKKFFKSKTGIIVSCVLISLFLILIGAIIVVLLLWYFKKPTTKKDEKTEIYTLNGQEIAFVPVDQFPFQIDVAQLTFGSENGVLEVRKSYEQKVQLRNKTNKKLKYKVEAPETHRMKITIKHGVDEVEKSYYVFFLVDIEILCTCKPDEFLMITSTDSKGTTLHTKLQFNFSTNVSPYVDYTELKNEGYLNQGAFGSVYKSTYLGLTVAVKEVKEAMVESEKEAFDQEVAIYSSIRNGYVVQFLGSSDVPRHTLMVMEFAPYGSVNDMYMKDEFSELLAYKCLTNCASGMRFLHSSHIMHRDLKPHNLLLFSTSPKVAIAAKISDFGTSRDVISIKQSAMMTNAVGTPAYMAPEMVSGGNYSYSVDVYSFAIIMFELLAKHPAYDNTELFQFSWNISQFVTSGKRLGIPTTFNHELADLIAKCWDQDPNKRPTFEVIDEFLLKFFDEQLQKHKSTKFANEQHIPTVEVTDTNEDGIIKDANPTPESNSKVVSLLAQDMF
ncbi:serine-threonine protein kinase, putative [Entamoeba invadens IP1]|uniref:Serine-threonine protein kinase, putative n=1 Tax=Entamoeba invadens IP1 TaxID=370355 RepID=A0A0A1U4M4_ENTIV|nr:serine-threonine protein kinase, putative [Entamoeba invadens IP1]ELP89149.1 serine-threonine protein kinase, putative [Entamoeba invadens IP1]|eukprot:XP_004255920.1 serine-threonine protein kinase, putative [Entamoeba invadens IP1]